MTSKQHRKTTRKDRTQSTNRFGQQQVQPHFQSPCIINFHCLQLTGQSAETRVKEMTGSSFSFSRSPWRRWPRLMGFFFLPSPFPQWNFVARTQVDISHTSVTQGHGLYTSFFHIIHCTVVKLKAFRSHNPKEDPTEAWWNWWSNRRNPRKTMLLDQDQGCWPVGQGCVADRGVKAVDLQLWPWCLVLKSQKGHGEGHLQWPFWASLAARMRGTRLARGFASRRKGCWTKRQWFFLLKKNIMLMHYCQVVNVVKNFSSIYGCDFWLRKNFF